MTNPCCLCYYINMTTSGLIMMEPKVVPTNIIQEADNLSKETGINFRDCLEMVYKAYLNKIGDRED